MAEGLGFEEALAALEERVRRIESGELAARRVMLESEHSMITAAGAAAATGVRAFTATSSQGLLYGMEMLYTVAGWRTPFVLVNVSRGELLDEPAVAAALESGHLGGLAMDVGRAPDQRPSPELASRPGVVATPHLGGLTPENADAQALSSVEQVRSIVDGEMPPRATNPEAASRLRDWWAAR